MPNNRSLEDHKKVVKEGIATRKRLREENHACPVCCERGILPCGGGGACWWEHECGAYSQMCRTWEDALKGEWQLVEPELNARMFPPVGRH
jgi:hypothetical protein